jgi:glycosyltransferase involved in cell wall biosynthesis
LRAKFSIPADHTILLCSARFHGEKGIDILLDAFSRLSNTKHTLVLAGTGPLEPELRMQAGRLGIRERVIFAGHLDRSDMWSAFKSADAFILLSKAEALGLVFWEAMYVDLPVIGSRADGIEETIGKGEERGYLWEPGDGIEALEERINHCIRRDEKTKERMAHARKYVEEKLADPTDIYTLARSL